MVKAFDSPAEPLLVSMVRGVPSLQEVHGAVQEAPPVVETGTDLDELGELIRRYVELSGSDREPSGARQGALQRVTSDLDIQEEIVLKVSYWNLEEGNRPKISFTITGPMAEAVFSSMNLPSKEFPQDPWSDQPHPVGLFETECRFPPNLFNTMTYNIQLQIDSTLRRPLDISEENVLSFTVHDMNGRDTPGINWWGTVRPKLPWNTKYLGNSSPQPSPTVFRSDDS